MKRIGLKVSSTLAAALLVILAMALPSRSMAQATGSASIHGHVNNPVGQPVTKGEVRLTTDRSSASEEKTGSISTRFRSTRAETYKGTGIAPGNYVVVVFQDDKSLDFIESVVFATATTRR